MEPVYTGRFKADEEGEVLFAFENLAAEEHVKFSGMTVRKCSSPGLIFNHIADKKVDACLTVPPHEIPLNIKTL